MKYSSTILIYYCNYFFFQCLLLSCSTLLRYRLCAFVTFKVFFFCCTVTFKVNCYYLIHSISLPYPLTNILIIFPPHPRHEILIHNPHLHLQLIFFQCLLLTFSTLLHYRLCDFVTFKVIICSLPYFYFSYKIINKIFYYHLFLDLQRHK